MRRRQSTASMVMIEMDELKMNNTINMQRSRRGKAPGVLRAQGIHPRRNVWLMKSPIGRIGHGVNGVPVVAQLVLTLSR